MSGAIGIGAIGSLIIGGPPPRFGDISIVWDPTTGTGDFSMLGSGLELGNDLESAVLISLFTDARASPDDQMPDQQRADRRGWWADTYEDDPIGSKLWQVFWRQTTPDTLNWVRDTASKALQWMLDDDVAVSVVVPQPQFLGKGAIGLQIIITEPDGLVTPFSYAWTSLAT